MHAQSDDLAGGDPRPEIHIRPVRHRIAVRDVTANLGLIRVLVARDLKVKYKQSVLGPIWLIFQPFALFVAFVIGFHSVANVDTGAVPYALFALTGLSMWSYFSAASAAGALSLLQHEPRAVHIVPASGAHARQSARVTARPVCAGARRSGGSRRGWIRLCESHPRLVCRDMARAVDGRVHSDRGVAGREVARRPRGVAISAASRRVPWLRSRIRRTTSPGSRRCCSR